MKKKVLIAVLVIVCIIGAVFGWYLYRMWPMLSTTMGDVEQTDECISGSGRGPYRR